MRALLLAATVLLLTACIPAPTAMPTAMPTLSATMTAIATRTATVTVTLQPTASSTATPTAHPTYCPPVLTPIPLGTLYLRCFVDANVTARTMRARQGWGALCSWPMTQASRIGSIPQL